MGKVWERSIRMEESMKKGPTPLAGRKGEQMTRKDFDPRLRCLYKNFNAITDITLRISFRMTRQKKNVSTIRAILDELPHACVSSVDTSGVVVSLPCEDVIAENMRHIVNLVVLIKGTRNRSFSSCGQELAWTEMLFLLKTISLRNSIEIPKISSITPERLKRLYNAVDEDLPLAYAAQTEPDGVAVSEHRKAFEGIVADVARRYREKYLKGFEVTEIATFPYEIVLVVEDSFVVDFCLVYKAPTTDEHPEVRYLEYQESDDEDLHCQIQELTFNNLFAFKHRVFVHSFQVSLATSVFLKRYKADDDLTADEYPADARYQDPAAHPDRTDAVAVRYPALDLKRRQELGPGIHYRFIILEIEDAEGTIVRAVGYAKPTFTNLFEKVVDAIEERGPTSLMRHGIVVKGARFVGDDDFVRAYLSHADDERDTVIEKRLSYYYLDLDVKDPNRIDDLAQEVLISAKRDFHTEMQRSTLQNPIMGPSKDVVLYTMVKRAYSEYRVIFDHRPHYLKVDGQPLSYTVFVCGLNVAIDYRDFYYFACEDYFGHRVDAKSRDEIGRRKEELSRRKGIRLVYLNYWEDVSLTQVQEKVSGALAMKL